MTVDQQFAAHLLSSGAFTRPASDNIADSVRLHELRSLFEVFVPSVSDNELSAVAAVQAELQAQQHRLEAMLDDGVIDDHEYAQAVNHEVAWCMRKAAAILGKDRARQLFGVEDFDQITVVHPLKLAVASGPFDLGVDVRRLTKGLITRYLSVPTERKQVQRAVERVNPQEWRMIAHHAWGEKARYADLAGAIAAAEEAYHAGAVHASIEHAHAALSAISSLEQITEAPLYLASWAHHIQGRGYEALMDWRRAALFYECSLAMKMRMEDWLSPLPVYATEIKLGAVQVFHSPIEAKTRLSRVTELLESKPRLFRSNIRFYRNLLEDSRLCLAEAYLAADNVSAAIEHANAALKLARGLDDIVGEIRILFVLHKAAVMPLAITSQNIRSALQREERLSTHPRVVLVLSQLKDEKLEDASPVQPQ